MCTRPGGTVTGPGVGGGSAEELNRLLTTLTQWAQRAMPAPASGHPGPECQWCPLCQLASVLRGEHPELTDRLAEAGAAVNGAVRALLDSSPDGWPMPTPDPRVPPAAEPPTAEPAADRATSDRPRRPRPRPAHDDSTGQG